MNICLGMFDLFFLVFGIGGNCRQDSTYRDDNADICGQIERNSENSVRSRPRGHVGIEILHRLATSQLEARFFRAKRMQNASHQLVHD